MRAMTSWPKVPGHSTWDTKPLAHASWAVSFLPLSNISLAWKREALTIKIFHLDKFSDPDPFSFSVDLSVFGCIHPLLNSAHPSLHSCSMMLPPPHFTVLMVLQIPGVFGSAKKVTFLPHLTRDELFPQELFQCLSHTYYSKVTSEYLWRLKDVWSFVSGTTGLLVTSMPKPSLHGFECTKCCGSFHTQVCAFGNHVQTY